MPAKSAPFEGWLLRNNGPINSIAIDVGNQGVKALIESGIISGGKLARKARGMMVKKNTYPEMSDVRLKAAISEPNAMKAVPARVIPINTRNTLLTDISSPTIKIPNINMSTP